MRCALVAAAAVSAFVAFAPGYARAVPAYVFTTIINPDGPNNTQAFGVNGLGQIVGFYAGNSGPHGFLRDAAGGSTIIDPPNGAAFITPQGINVAGQIVGSSVGGTGQHGFLRNPTGSFTIIDDPNATIIPRFGPNTNTSARGINAAGQIVGGYLDASGSHGFVRDAAGSFTTIDDPKATNDTGASGNLPGTGATSINDAGQIVGTYNDTSGTHGFLRDVVGNFISLDDPNATLSTAPSGINAACQIVGNYRDASGDHGFLRDAAGGFTTIDPPNSTNNTFVSGINDAGQIVGFYSDNSGIYGYLATPLATAVPEPAPLAVLGAGLIGLCLMRRRRTAA